MKVHFFEKWFEHVIESLFLEQPIHIYALVICNHGPPPPEGGQEFSRCFYFLIVPAVRGKCQGFVLYRQTWQCNENITDYGGKRAVVLPTGCPRSAGLLAGICRTKVKVPAIPRGWGGRGYK